MREGKCSADCRCPNCDATMRAVASMDMNQYAAWLQATTAGMLATAPKGPNIIPAEYQAMSDYEAAPTDGQPAPARPSTPLHEVRAGVERVRREMAATKARMAAERKGSAARNRILREYAADAAYAAEVRPGPYDAALRREINPDVNPDLYDVLLSITDKPTAELPAPPPRPYDAPIRRLRERDRMRDAHR